MIELSRGLAAALAPHAAGERLALLDAGFSFEVVATHNRVFRVPRTGAAATRLASERPLLAYLAKRLPMAVPNELFRIDPSPDLPFGASVAQRLPGGPPSAQQLGQPLAAEFGRLLAALHGLSTADAEGAGIAARDARWGTLAATRTETAAVLSELVPPRECRRVLTIWDRLFDEAVGTSASPAVVHGDAWHGNLLVAGSELVGIVDWEHGGLGDPAEDLALAQHAGAPFAEALWDAYRPLDDDLRHRIRLWWGMRELSGFLPAAQAGDRDELASCVEKLRRSALWAP